MSKTLTYYNQNAKEFASATQSVDFAAVQEKFTSLLPEQGMILDFGCGSGRDTKAFLEQGFRVEAIDGSEELCKIASDYTGIQVRHMLFQELDEKERYDGVWACSSILHLPYGELAAVITKIAASLKKEGYFYTSFKYGEFEGDRNGRYFINMTEERLGQLLKETGCFRAEKLWITSDVRPGRDEEKWLNVILQKK